MEKKKEATATVESSAGAAQKREKEDTTETYLEACRAVQWTKDHPDAWSAVIADARKHADEKRPYAIQQMVETIRSKSWASGNKAGHVCVKHDIRTALVRIVLANVPSLRPYVVLRNSKFDAPGMPWEAMR